MNTGALNDEGQRILSQGIPAQQLSPALQAGDLTSSAMSAWEIAEHCKWEIRTSRDADSCDDAYTLELFRRAIVQEDQEAWAWVQHCFSGLVRGWLRRHPRKETACRLESDENYVAQAFERFWQATTLTHRVEFHSLAAALHYLRASLNGAIMDTLRAYARPGEVSLPEPGEAWEPYQEDVTDSSEMWEVLQTMLSNKREQRLAYLLFHCGLKSREIVRFCPQEFSDVQEIYRMRRSIMERLLRNADQLRWRLGEGG